MTLPSTSAQGADVVLPASGIAVTPHIQTSESVLASALDAMDFCIAILAGPELRYLHVNQAYRQLAPGKDILGRRLSEIFTDVVSNGVEAGMQEVLHTGKPWHIARFSMPVPNDADAVWVGRVERLPVQQGSPAAITVWMQNVTPTVQTETALRQDVSLLRAISETSTDVIFAKDCHGRMRFANPAALELIGKPLEHVLGRTDAEFLGDKSAAQFVMENDRRIMDSGLAEEVEEEVPLPDGSKRVWLSQKRPYHDESGRVAGLLGISRDITERKQVEAQLREAHDSLQRVFNSISDGLAILDRQWRYTYFSETGANMLGVKREDMLGKCLWDLYPHAENSLFGREYRHAMDAGVATHFEEYYPAPLDMWVECHCYPSSDGLSVYFRDVTDRRHAQEAADESERRINALLEASPVGLAYIAPGGKILVMNTEALRIWGNPPMSERIEDYGQWKGWFADDSVRHGQPVAPNEWPTARALAGETVIDEVLEIEPFDRPGTRRTILLRSAPIHGAEGAVTGAVTAQMDITEQVAIRAAVAEADHRLRQLANTIPQLAWMANADGYIHWYNERWYAYTGTTLAEMEGSGWQSVHDPAGLPKIIELWQRSIATGAAFEMTFPLRGRDGTYRPFYTLVEPLRDASGKVVQWFGTNTDVTALQKTQEELLQANHRKDEFLAMLAHELRNPLAPISTAAQLLRLSISDAKRVALASEIIGRQVHHMTALIDDLLDVSRVTRGLIKLDTQLVDIKSVIGNAVEQTRPLIESREHTLSIQLGALHTAVHGDPVRLVQVVSNVLSNAAKYTPQGGHIALSVEARKTEVEITVKDNGSGIEPRLLPHIFELFTQGQRTPDRAQGGLGLGLSLVKSLVELHDGHVAAYSEGPGRGSSFKITLPICHQKFVGTGERVPRQATVCRPLAVMIVDDNADAGLLLQEVLAADGHQVSMFVEPFTALEYASDHMPKVCVLDIGLPGIDGYELARRLRANPRTAGAMLIALTGYGQSHDKVLSEAAGFDYHFVKPVNIGELKVIFERIR
jgi:PAS domain S-box-containing protein